MSRDEIICTGDLVYDRTRPEIAGRLRTINDAIGTIRHGDDHEMNSVIRVVDLVKGTCPEEGPPDHVWTPVQLDVDKLSRLAKRAKKSFIEMYSIKWNELNFPVED